jgi:hypothetical protein
MPGIYGAKQVACVYCGVLLWSKCDYVECWKCRDANRIRKTLGEGEHADRIFALLYPEHFQHEQQSQLERVRELLEPLDDEALVDLVQKVVTND